jgi:hypothetical protein
MRRQEQVEYQEADAKSHAARGLVTIIGPAHAQVVGPSETAVVTPTPKEEPFHWNLRTPKPEPVTPVHVGGGWYQVGEERVQGKARAEARAAELNGE